MKWTLSAKVAAIIDADDSARLLREVIRANPAEVTPANELVDRLQELAVAAATAHRFVRLLVLLSTPIEAWPAADRRALLRGTTEGEIAAALAVANGRRRERTLSLDDCLRACYRARANGFGWVGGGTVANAYKYASAQTGFVAAVSSSGRLRWVVGVVSASKGTSVSNRLCGLRSTATAADWRRWADEVTVAPAVE